MQGPVTGKSTADCSLPTFGSPPGKDVYLPMLPRHSKEQLSIVKAAVLEVFQKQSHVSLEGGVGERQRAPAARGWLLMDHRHVRTQECSEMSECSAVPESNLSNKQIANHIYGAMTFGACYRTLVSES